jgi:hypothetical protein
MGHGLVESLDPEMQVNATMVGVPLTLVRHAFAIWREVRLWHEAASFFLTLSGLSSRAQCPGWGAI